MHGVGGKKSSLRTKIKEGYIEKQEKKTARKEKVQSLCLVMTSNTPLS